MIKKLRHKIKRTGNLPKYKFLFVLFGYPVLCYFTVMPYPFDYFYIGLLIYLQRFIKTK